ncbi:Cytochrome c-type biogenesis protein CcmF [Baekduia alba]|uniref:heme lyase CcmF/NrfE family subunit n=1 Tax=Baekduia alba TaxID=2997333 RepID=UPI0023401171|nr:cytochrome c-type biogenesis CcmF C-terminal domain-containing protein [Baekduia alba]WCB93033.1 Cytochrome c-type biogenesis protein CcmF [Baekduia alba]
MADLGRGLVFLAFAVALYGVVAALYGGLAHKREWVTSARRAVYALAALTSGAFVVLEVAFLRSDFSFSVVQSHSSTTTPTFYKAAAAWSSQEGSLLLWLWLLSVWSSLVVFLTRHRMRDVQPYAIAVLMAFAVFFGGLLVFAVSPFDTLAIAPSEGTGLNPLLRHPSMMIHPPMLYSGYTLWAVPFAFAVGALAVRRVDAEWIGATRRFALAAWFFLGVGIFLGARWSYAELGWGGYWAWDPVENASLLPWLTGTAFLHSIMVQEKRGMLKTWNASLILATGTLAILGTFLVRSGILDSIHAFGASTLGIPFVILIGVMIAGSVALVVSRRDVLRTEHKLDSLLSREAMFLGNNLVLVGMAFVVFWGTFFPLISEAMTGQKQSLGPPWYDKYVVPLALVLVLLSGIGPVIAWRRATPKNARRNFLWPIVTGIVTVIVLIPFGVAGRPWALLMFAFAAFAIGTITQEFARGVRARRAMTGEPVPLAFITLIRRNRRRYGGYTIHVGMALLFIGVAASTAFQHVHTVELKKGQSTELGRGYVARYDGPTSRIDVTKNGVERLVFGARLTVFKHGKKIGVLKPERGYYPIEGAPFAGAIGKYFEGESTSEIAMMAGVGRDVWSAVTPDLDPTLATVKQGDAVFKGAQGKMDQQEYSTALGTAIRGLTDNYAKSAPPATFRLIVSPLVAWVWIGGLMVFLGGLICIWPTPDLAHRRATAGYAARVARDLGRA